MEGDLVRLRLPGDPAYGRLARIAATALARRLGFSFRQTEDLALAVDETVILLLQTTDDEPVIDGLVVELDVVGGGITLTARAELAEGSDAGDPAALPVPEPAHQRFEALVSTTVPDWTVDAERRQVVLRTGPPTG